MRVEVFSMMSAISGSPHGTTWRGEIPNELLGHGNAGQNTLEQIFRLLNRVEQDDTDRMQRWGYELPSLSVGDFVTLHLNGTGIAGPITEPITFRVKSTGFEQVTRNEQYAMQAFI